MFNQKSNHFPFKVQKEQPIYTLKHLLTGRGDFGIKLAKLISKEGDTYKMIRLNLLGVVQGLMARLETISQNVRLFENDSSVPELIYSDDKCLILEWIDGIELSRVNKNKDNYRQLADFNSKGLKDIKREPIESELTLRREQIKILSEKSVLNTELYSKLNHLISEKKFLDSTHLILAVGFGDSALKNYIYNEACKSLVYIDVFGISRRDVGRMYLKHLSQHTPKEVRKVYAEQFKKNLIFDLTPTLNFSYLNYLIAKIYSSVIKMSLRNYRNRTSKIRKSLDELSAFLHHWEKGISAEDWVINYKN